VADRIGTRDPSSPLRKVPTAGGPDADRLDDSGGGRSRPPMGMRKLFGTGVAILSRRITSDEVVDLMRDRPLR
jgi:hypothetical protein